MFKFENFHKFKIQIFATLAVCITAFLHGAGLGWLSPAIIHLQSDRSHLIGGPITNEQVSWLGSIFPVGSTIASFLFGYIGNAYGRKPALVCLIFSQLTFWFTIIFAKHIEALYFARIMSGLNAGSSFVTIPIYISEISSKEIRGGLCSSFSFAMSIGITVGYILGAYLPYEIVPRIFVGFPILYFICIFKLPETPQFLYLHGRHAESRKSLQFYSNAGCLGNTVAFEELFNELQANCRESDANAKIELQDFVNRPTLKIFGHSLILASIYLLTGGFVIINLAGSVFKESGANFDPNTSAIVLGFSQILGCYISILISNRMTRKNLIALSCGLSFIGLMGTAIFVQLSEYYEDLRSFGWIPTVSLSYTIVCMSFGIMSMAFSVIAELVPQKIKFYAYALVNILSNFVSIANFQVFSILMFDLGLASALFFCAVSCLVSVVYVLAYMPETSKKFV